MRTHRHVLAALALTAAATAATTVTACAGHGPGGAPAAPGPAGRSWWVQSLTVQGRTLTAPAAAQVTLSDRSPYEATGNYGCNGFTARVSFDGPAMLVEPGATTAMACPDMEFETAFAKSFRGRLAFREELERLTLTTPGGDVISLTTQPRTPAAPLLATRWTVTSLISGDTTAPLPAGAAGKAAFTLAADGAASGTLGCNRFTARAAVEAARLTFGPLATTRIACPGEEGEVERALTGLFGSGPLAWKIQGDTLTLTAPDGRGLRAEAASAAE
ncbi:META domain-containing protein [Streptomyces sp. NPDC091268]|uniref:META domain-containing protein n=1 Tax=Streptomyces sp. NPDC091268 TaxID=3365979 RepID=UPI00381E1DBF